MAQILHKGERDGSYKAGYTKGQLEDQAYYAMLAYHDPLWRYVVTRFKDEKNCPVVVLGYHAIPIAIELSQWTYPVTYVTDTYEGVKKAQKDCEIQAGFFKDFYYFDFKGNIPQARVAIFMGILDDLAEDQIHRYLDLLLRRVRVVVCAQKSPRDWQKILGDRYNVEVYPYKYATRLVIREHE